MEEIQTETPSVNSNMSGQELLDAVRNQVEYYFSKENLQSDAFLTSQMDAQMSVPISFVMKFAKMKALTQDEAVIRQALENSTITQIVDNRIKANIKPAGRSTIILREIPSDASVEEVKEIFNYEGCKVVSSIRSDIGDSWFVHMDCEEDAKDTLLDLRMKKRTFRGQSVKARLKTETVIRSFYPLQSAPIVPVGYPAMGFPGPMDMRAFGYALPEGVMPPVAMLVTESESALAVEGGKAADSESAQNAPKSSSGNNSSKDGRNKQQHSRGSNASNNGTNAGSSSAGKRGENSGSGSRSKASNNVASSSKAPVIEINSANFPPLQNSEETPVPTPGYKGAYQKYSFEEIIAIVKEVKEATLPPALNPVNHPLALTATPNLDLLKKQRTYSIDETREQLRQGRPVHREAVTAGAVDYRSMMYGDEGQQQQSSVSTTAVPAVATTAQPAVTNAVPAAKAPTAKARSNSQSSVGENQQTPKKISASSWAAMVKSSAAATAAADSAVTPAKPVRQAAPASTTKAAGAPSADAKKAASTTGGASKGGDRKRSSSKGGENKEPKSGAAAATGGVPAEGRRDRKKGGNKDGQPKKDEEGVTSAVVADAPSAAGETPNVTATEQSGAPAVGAPWGGKTSFAQIVKLKTPEDGPDSPATASSPSPVKASGGEAAAPVTKKSSAGSGAGRQPQTASKSGSNGNRTGSRSAGSKEGGAERRVRNGSSAEGGPSASRKPAADRAAAPNNASSSAAAGGGASASGVWVREALPALAKK